MRDVIPSVVALDDPLGFGNCLSCLGCRIAFLRKPLFEQLVRCLCHKILTMSATGVLEWQITYTFTVTNLVALGAARHFRDNRQSGRFAALPLVLFSLIAVISWNLIC